MSVNDVLVKMETQDQQQQIVVHNTAATDIYFNNPITTNSQPQQMNMDNSNLIQYCQPQQQTGVQQQIPQQQQYFAEHHHPPTYSHSFMLPQQTAMDSAYDYRSVTWWHHTMTWWLRHHVLITSLLRICMYMVQAADQERGVDTHRAVWLEIPARKEKCWPPVNIKTNIPLWKGCWVIKGEGSCDILVN